MLKGKMTVFQVFVKIIARGPYEDRKRFFLLGSFLLFMDIKLSVLSMSSL